jgi:hypothetical protein
MRLCPGFGCESNDSARDSVSCLHILFFPFHHGFLPRIKTLTPLGAQAPAQTPDEVMRELKLYIGGGIAVLLLGLLFTVVRPMLQMAE